MPKFAHYDPAVPSPQHIIGWYDTDELDYPSLPDPTNLLALTQAQWDTRLSTPFVQNGILIATPAPSAAHLLATAQADRITYIEEQYEIREHADIVYLGSTFQADDGSQELISRALAAQNGTASADFGWYDITNTKVPMTNADLHGLANAILLRNQPLFDNKQAKKAAIRAAATAAEAEAIIW